MIMRAMEHHVPWSELKEILAEMLDALDGSIARAHASC